MNRLQIVIAVGLFLIVGLFGWQSYLNKRASEAEANRTDQRGISADKVPGLQKHLDAASKAKSKTKAELANPNIAETPKSGTAEPATPPSTPATKKTETGSVKPAADNAETDKSKQ